MLWVCTEPCADLPAIGDKTEIYLSLGHRQLAAALPHIHKLSALGRKLLYCSLHSPKSIFVCIRETVAFSSCSDIFYTKRSWQTTQGKVTDLDMSCLNRQGLPPPPDHHTLSPQPA